MVKHNVLFIKKIFLLAVGLLIGAVMYAQSHTYKIGCRYFKVPHVAGQVQVRAEAGCPGCNKEKEDERNAKLAEDKRRADIVAAEEKAKAEKIKADKEAADRKQKIEAEKRKQREEARKELEEYTRNKEKYLEKMKIDVNRSYPGYDAVRASREIPSKMKLLKLVENKSGRAYELYSGEVLVKSFSQELYWVYSLNKSLPYFVLEERQGKTSRKSIIDSRGEPMTISGEKYFESIQFNEKNNTLEFEIAQEQKELLSNLCLDEIVGLYNSKADALKMKNIAELEVEKRPKVPDEYDSYGNRIVKIAGICIHPYGHSAKRIVAGLDLSVLENRPVYRVQ